MLQTPLVDMLPMLANVQTNVVFIPNSSYFKHCM